MQNQQLREANWRSAMLSNDRARQSPQAVHALEDCARRFSWRAFFRQQRYSK
jgi:hypothetical protein